MPTSTGAVGSGLPIDALINSGTSGPPQAQSLSSQLGEDAFLKLLTTQIQNQDPLHPMDDTQSIAQLAQFSSVQAMTELKTSFSNFESGFAVMQSAGLLGKTVAVSTTDGSGNSSTLSGTVKSILVVNGQPSFTMTDANGNLVVDSHGQPKVFSTSQITGIK